MQPRTLESILSQLGTTYDPQVNSIRQRQAEIPGQVQAEEQGLQAKQTQAYDDILGGARRRGLGFAGIPLGEQAKYSATEYMPALARLRQGAREQALSLEDAILGINERRNTQAQSIYQGEQSLAEQQRQFNENLRFQQQQASRSGSGGGGFSPTLGGGAPTQAQASATQRANGGYDFTDAAGKPVSAARYAQLSGKPIGDVLYQMGASGDKYAQQAYNLLAEQAKLGIGLAPGTKSKYSALFWGT